MKKSESFRHGTMQIILNLTQKRQKKIVDFRKKKQTPPPLVLQNKNVERSYKYLGVTITEQLDRADGAAQIDE